MRQFPLFVPSGTGHVAAVLTTPDSDAHGIVISLPAVGRTTIIGSTLCGRLSETLAERGIASVRLDYSGVGDSAGVVESWTPVDVDAVVDQARASVAAARGALGVDRFAVVATCYGTRVAMHLMADPACAGAVCLAAPLLDHGGLARAGGRVRGRVSALRSIPLVRRLSAPLRHAAAPRKPAAPALAALTHLDHARLVLLYGRIPAEDHYSERALASLQAAVAELPPAHRARFELRMVPWGPLTTFDLLPQDDQSAVLELVLRLVDDCFEGELATEGAAPSAQLAGTPAAGTT